MKDNSNELDDPMELVKEFLRVKGYSKTIENLEIEDKQKNKKVY